VTPAAAIDALAEAWVDELSWLAAVSICDRVGDLRQRHALYRAARRLWLG